VITGGVPLPPGDTMLERKLHFEEHLDDLRLLLMNEPRGHAAPAPASSARPVARVL
jgi:proline racemase